MKGFVRLQTGDTIVEVIIAIAIVASTLLGAFVLTNKSTQYVRDSEEHAQALQLLQGQVESLRAAAEGRIPLPTNLTTLFCFNGTSFYQPADTDAHCLNQGIGNLYNVSIQCIVSASNSCPNSQGIATFTLIASWQGLHTQDTANLWYRLDVTP